jgi:hypothetical protein
MITVEQTKRCSMCGETKPLTEFYVERKRRGDGYGGRCKPCLAVHIRQRRQQDSATFREYDRRWREKNPEKKQAWDRRYYDQNKEKVRAQANAYYGENRESIRAAEQQKRQDDPGKYRLVERRRALAKYGLSLEDYDRLLEEQGGVCAICGQRCKTGRNLAVDHCHTSGKVRGLLCGACNSGLGHFKEDPALFAAAVGYLAERG